MKATQAQTQALLGLLNRFYGEIRSIEEQYHIYVRPEDFRPRIEYFHDVVREFTQNIGDGFARTGRLSVESLALDAYMLRQIQEKPLIRHPELAIPLSTGTAVIPRPNMAGMSNRVDVSVAAHLGEGYGHYALLFISLLATPAERNYMNRLNECNQQQDNLRNMIDALPQERNAPVTIEAALAQVSDPELYRRLLAALQAKKQKRLIAEDVTQIVQAEKTALRATATSLESAHMRYASSQLMLYQEAQGVVKKMASQGLNIVGEFVENAMREAQKGGRGF